MNSVNILIIDDSKDFSSQLRRALTGAKILPVVANTPDEALKICASQKFKLLIIDCMLPKMNGADLAKKLHEMQPEAKILMMSGIFKDASFSNQIKSEPYIDDYLLKPFDVSQINNYIKKTWASIAISQVSDDYPFLKVFTSARSIIDFLENSEKINSFSISKILYSLLQHNVNGTLNFKRNQMHVEIVISNQKIIQVKSSDEPTTFGKLLVEEGYISESDLNQFMASSDFKSSNSPLGQKLERANLISPHACFKINKRQMIDRLTRLFVSGDFKVDFDEHEIRPIDESHLTLKSIEEQTELWASNLVSNNWLAEAFETIQNLKPSFTNENSLKSVHIDRLTSGLINSMPIENINPDLAKTELYKSLFYAFSLNLVSLGIGAVEGQQDLGITLDMESLTKLKKRIKDKNHFEIFNVTENIEDKDLQKKYHSMAKNLHPDKVPLNIDPELKIIIEEVFATITDSFNSIKTKEARNAYLLNKRQDAANTLMENEKAIVSAKELLLNSKYTSAFNILNNDELKKDPPSLFNMYFCWAALKTQSIDPNVNKKSVISAFMSEKESLKSSIEGLFVGALIKAHEGNYDGFKLEIQKCLKKEPTFLPARRELSVVKSKAADEHQKTSSGWSLFKKSS